MASLVDQVIASGLVSSRLSGLNIGPPSREDLEIAALTIAGEIDTRFSPWGDPKTAKEVASIMEVVESRFASNRPAAFGRTGVRDPVTGKVVGSVRGGYKSRSDVMLQDMQFSTWNTSTARNIAKANLAKFGPQIHSAIAGYYTGRVDPAVKNATHYWNPSIVSPGWAKGLKGRTKMGPHEFGRAPGLVPADAFNAKVDSLKAGTKGPGVQSLQAGLKSLGFDPGPVDGVYGKATATAVEAAQKSLGLTPDGVAGPETQHAINAALAVSATPELGLVASPFADPTQTGVRGVPEANFARSLVEARTATPGRNLPGVVQSVSKVSQEVAKDQAKAAIRGALGRPEPAVEPTPFASSPSRTQAQQAIDRQFGPPEPSPNTAFAGVRGVRPSTQGTLRSSTSLSIPALADPEPIASRSDLAIDMKASPRMGSVAAPALTDPAATPGARGLEQTARTSLFDAPITGRTAEARTATPGRSLPSDSAVAQAEAEREALAQQVGTLPDARSAAADRQISQALDAARAAPVDTALEQALADRAGRGLTGLPSFGDVAAARHAMPSTMDPALGIPTAQTLAGMGLDTAARAPVSPARSTVSLAEARTATPGRSLPDTAQQAKRAAATAVETTAPLTSVFTDEQARPATRDERLEAALDPPEVIQVSRPPAEPTRPAPDPDRPEPAPLTTGRPSPRDMRPDRIGRPHALETRRAGVRELSPRTALGRSGTQTGFNLGSGLGLTGIHSVDRGMSVRSAALGSGQSRSAANMAGWSAFEASAPKTGWARETAIAQMSRSMALANNMGKSQNQAAGLAAAQAAGAGKGAGVSTGTSSAGVSSSGGSTSGGIAGGPGSTGHTGHDDSGPGSGSSGSKVLCTEFHRIGWLPTPILRAEHVWTTRNIDPRARAAYRLWAKPLIRFMERRQWLRRAVFKMVSEPWAYEAAYRLGKYPRSHWFGRLNMQVMIALNTALAVLLPDKVLADEWWSPAPA